MPVLFPLISCQSMQPFIGDADYAVAAVERAPSAAAMSTSAFQLPWTTSSRAVAPSAPPQPPLRNPSRIFAGDAVSREIELVFSNSDLVPTPSISIKPHACCRSRHRRQSGVLPRRRAVPAEAAAVQASPIPSYSLMKIR